MGDNAAFYLQEIALILGISQEIITNPENANNTNFLMEQITTTLKKNIPNLHIFSKNDKFLLNISNDESKNNLFLTKRSEIPHNGEDNILIQESGFKKKGEEIMKIEDLKKNLIGKMKKSKNPRKRKKIIRN